MRWGRTVGARACESKHGIDLDRTFSDLAAWRCPCPCRPPNARPGSARLSVDQARRILERMLQACAEQLAHIARDVTEPLRAQNYEGAKPSWAARPRDLRLRAGIIGRYPGTGLAPRQTVGQKTARRLECFGVAGIGIRVCLTVAMEECRQSLWRHHKPHPTQAVRRVPRAGECGAPPEPRITPHRRSREARLSNAPRSPLASRRPSFRNLAPAHRSSDSEDRRE